MSANAYGKPPLVSEDTFARFRADIEDQGAAHRYLLDYVLMWDGRYSRLCAAITAANLVSAMDAVFSVRTSSSMIGALRLAALALHIQRHLSAGEAQHAMVLLDELGVCGELTIDEFRDRILPGFGPDSTHDRGRCTREVAMSSPTGELARIGRASRSDPSPPVNWAPSDRPPVEHGMR